MKNLLTILAIAVVFPLTSSARIIRLQSYEELYQQADLVAIVELQSVSRSKETMPGHTDPNRFEGKVARLAVGLVLKGDADIKTINFLHFAYTHLAELNGANFISFHDAKKHHYLVFLKKDKKGNLVPVTGHYDAALSLKIIVNDHHTPIDRKK